jgi:SAM-dependent methyltransferase
MRATPRGRACDTVAVPEPEYSDDYADPRLAILYDQLNPWGPADDFYLGLVMPARSVLDVGCGTGHVLRRARQAGHAGRLVGLDPAAAMLDQARARADVDWRLGDLGSVPFRGEFDLVIMTGHVFQVFLADADIAAALAAVRAVLAPGVVEVTGRFSSPAWDRDILCPSRLRFTGAAALDAFLARAGLTAAQRYGSWDKAPFRQDAPEIITIAMVS